MIIDIMTTYNISLDEMSVGKMSVEKMTLKPVDKMTLEPVDIMTLEKMSVDKMNFRRNGMLPKRWHYQMVVDIISFSKLC
jgi:hypothetical protein